MRIYNLMMYLIFSDYSYWFFFSSHFWTRKNTRWMHSKSSSHWFRFNHWFVWYIIKEFTWIRLEYFDKAKQEKKNGCQTNWPFQWIRSSLWFHLSITHYFTYNLYNKKQITFDLVCTVYTGYDLHVANKLYSIYTKRYYIFTASLLSYGSKTK